jgi:membrane protease YdiL (CAAX protease family)
MNSKKLVAFLTVTFITSWTLWALGLNHIKEGLSQETFSTFLAYFFSGVYGPTISALIVTLWFEGPSGVMRLIKKVLIWKFPVKYYAYVFLLPLLFVAIAIAIYGLFIGDVGKFEPGAIASIPIVLWSGLYAGPLGEELGWRGFLLPEFQKRFSMLSSAIVVGIIWFLWHIPLFWSPFGTLVSGRPITFLPVAIYFSMLLFLSVIISWLVSQAKGSVLIAILFHLFINAGIAMLFFPELSAHFQKVHLLSGMGMMLFTVLLVVNLKGTPKSVALNGKE